MPPSSLKGTSLIKKMGKNYTHHKRRFKRLPTIIFWVLLSRSHRFKHTTLLWWCGIYLNKIQITVCFPLHQLFLFSDNTCSVFNEWGIWIEFFLFFRGAVFGWGDSNFDLSTIISPMVLDEDNLCGVMSNSIDAGN